MKIDDATLEVVFSRQMETSVQLAEIMKDYNRGCIKGTNARSYKYLRGEIDMHLDIEKKYRQRQKLQGTATHGSQYNATKGGGGGGGGGKGGGRGGQPRRGPGKCNQWMQSGACSRVNKPGGCEYTHLPKDQGKRKGGGPKGGRGKGKDGSGGKGKDRSGGKGKDRSGGKGKDRSGGKGGDKNAKGGKDRGRSPNRAGDNDKQPRNQTPGDRAQSASGRPRKCAYWDKDCCKNGKECPFDHPPPCKDWTKGHCPKGKLCTYRHLKKPAAYAASETEKEDESKAKPQVVASKRGLRNAKAKAREAAAYVASLQEAMTKRG